MKILTSNPGACTSQPLQKVGEETDLPREFQSDNEAQLLQQMHELIGLVDQFYTAESSPPVTPFNAHDSQNPEGRQS
jgi:hypothetical protein